MKIIFSEHAELKISQRKLSREQIVSTVAHPDFRRHSYISREELFKKFRKNYLKVVIIEEHDKTIIITAHWVAHLPEVH